MSFVRGMLLIALLLALQAGLNRIWAGAPRYLDLMLLPPIWYGLARSQRSAMIVGCAGGLVRDGWFRAEAFGLDGFKKTLVGWLVGALGTRFDLNNALARLVAGFAVSLVDTLLELGLRRLLDLDSTTLNVGEILLRAAATGILVVWGYSIAERFRRSRFAQRWN